MLQSAGFERIDTDDERKLYEKEFSIENYSEWYFVTPDDNPIVIDMSSRLTNNNAEWHMHIDNKLYETIGTADISYVEQFNKIMEIFESKFKLNNGKEN